VYKTHIVTMGNNFEEGYVYKSPEHDQHHFFLWKTWSWEFQKKIHTALFWQKCVLFSLKDDNINSVYHIYIYNIRTLLVKMKFICTSFRNRQNSEQLASFSGLFRSEYKWISYLTTMCVFCVYSAMSKKSENLSDLDKKDRNKRHSSPFINVVKGVFFVVRVTLVPVSYLSAPSAVHSYRVPGKFICRLKSLFV
jgi:hypothetical protein